MSEFCFCVSRIKPTRTTAKQMEKIAAKHGATLMEINEPGNGYKRWFAGPNRGNPFDQRMADAVYADLERAGIFTSDGTLVEGRAAKSQA